MDKSKSSIGCALKKIRLQYGFEQKELARLINVTPSALAQWEAGTRIPKEETVKKICAAMGVKYNSFMVWVEIGMPNDEFNNYIGSKLTIDYDPADISPYLLIPLVRDLAKLNREGQQKVLHYVNDIRFSPNYIK